MLCRSYEKNYKFRQKYRILVGNINWRTTISKWTDRIVPQNYQHQQDPQYSTREPRQAIKIVKVTDKLTVSTISPHFFGFCTPFHNGGRQVEQPLAKT
jgi:hypothetical protein